ncbi:MAG: ABC transporter six-transmembrane domain-containing protein [Chloroflexota bacterium]
MTANQIHLQTFTLGALFKRFKGRISLTILLVIAEAGVNLLFPLFMGFAINGLLAGTYNGLIYLAVLGVFSLLLGAGRRLYDTRIYAGIYTKVVSQLVDKEQKNESSVSKISARTNLFTEFVEFLENTFPEVVNSFIGLFGTLLIIYSLNQNIFLACLIASVFVVIIYWLSSKRNFRLNKGYNDELEKQVDVLTTANNTQIEKHFKNVMRWNIKLSDFETFNFSLVWAGMIVLLLYAIVAAVNSGITAYGTVFSIIVYVFEFMSSVIALPLYYQQLIRLNEISTRLND